jgi:broad specificity phosphatase PhoE
MTAEYVTARWSLSVVYASPLRRAMETADAIARAQGLKVQPLDGLLDIDYGEWEGAPLADLRDDYPELYRAWLAAPHTVRFPGGEGLEDVRERSVAALLEVVERHPGQTVALVAHTVVNRVLLCAILDLGNDHFWYLRQDTCAVNLIEWNGERYRLALMNDTGHLWQAEGT